MPKRRPIPRITPQLLAAVRLFEFRHGDYGSPDGRLNARGFWQPSQQERQSCCDGVEPRPDNPNALAIHCTSNQHCAELHAVELADMVAACSNPEVRLLALLRCCDNPTIRAYHLDHTAWDTLRLELVPLTNDERAQLLSLDIPEARMAVIRSLGATPTEPSPPSRRSAQPLKDSDHD